MHSRLGDKIAIAGSYQYDAYHHGMKPQRFWHYAKLLGSLESVNFQPNEQVLDAGCGSGLLAWLAADRYAAEVLGVDANPDAISFAQKQFEHPRLRFNVGLLDDLDFSAHSFDKIFFLEVLEHLTPEQGRRTLRRFHTWLKPGGVLVMSTPNRRSLWPVIEWTLDTFRLVPQLAETQHEHLYRYADIYQLLQETGFKNGRITTLNTIAPWLATISWELARRVHLLELKHAAPWGTLLLSLGYK